MIKLSREEYLNEAVNVSEQIAALIGNTMTVIGKFVGLKNGDTVNDGITILKDIDFDGNLVGETILSKIIIAADNTDNFAGDGTSATTVISAALIQTIRDLNNRGVHYLKIEKDLNEFESKIIEWIETNKYALETEQDYINLATVSTKDEELGEFIGKAYFQAGEEPMIVMKPRMDIDKDFVETQSGYVLNTSLHEHHVPQEQTNVAVFIINDPINNESEALKKVATWAFTNKRNTLILTPEVGLEGLRFMYSINKLNEKTGITLSLAQVPKSQNKYLNESVVLGDLEAVTGTKITHLETIRRTHEITPDMYGQVDNIIVQQDGTYLFWEKTSYETKDARIKEIEEQLVKVIKNQEESRILKARLNMLKGKTTYLNFTASSVPELQTKKLRIQDAVKSTEYTLKFGYLPGAGSSYAKMYRSKLLEGNMFNEILLAVPNKVIELAGILEGSTLHKKVDGFIGDNTADSNDAFVIDKKDYSVSFKDPIKAGVIDSAMVTLNIIKNSVSIARDINRTHYKLYDSPVEDKR